MSRTKTYVGLDQDNFGGMTPTGTIVRDAQVFGLIPETETCAGWTADRIQLLYDQVSEAWRPFGQLASRLPEELRERHQRIFAAAIEQGRTLGWKPELYTDDE